MSSQPVQEPRHFSHVSIRDLLEGKEKSREIRPNLELARKVDIAIVRVEPGGIEVPAVVTIRTVITGQSKVGARIRDSWHVTIAPDSEALRRRLFAETNATRLGAFDAPIAGMVAASYDAVKALKNAHEGLSALNPPRIGAYVEMSFAFARDMTPFVTYRPSSVEVLRRARGWAKHHNELAQARWSAAHFPFNGPVTVGGMQVWPWWEIDEAIFEIEPKIPQTDPWEPGGELYEKIGDVVGDQFYEILESLWKAAFKQDPFVAQQLTAQGYHLDRIDATRMGVGSMRELMGRFNNHGHMTMMDAPDIIRELGPENIRALTMQGNTNFSVEINDPD